MKRQKRNWLISLCGVCAAFGLVAGAWFGMPNVKVDASDEAPIVTMVPGASTRKDEDNPGIKFTAKVENYNPAYTYGMLILPEGAWTKFGWDNNTDYIASLASEGITEYANIPCGVYVATDANGNRIEGDYEISGSLKNINTANYAESFVGVAYTCKNGVYDYADVDLVTNARSIAYVAQMALKYEEGLTARQKAALKSYAAPGIIIEQEDYDSTNGSTGGLVELEGNYAMKYVFNASGETVSQVTKQAYAGGSTVSFKYYIPSDTVTSWWGLAYSTSNTALDIYAAADAGKAHVINTKTGVWTDVSFTLPSGGPYYLYFGSEVGASGGRWMVNGENSYALIEDFTVNGETEKFSANTADWIFNVISVAGVKIEVLEKPGVGFEGSASVEGTTDYMLAFNEGSIGGNERIAMITDKAYSGVTEISFKAKWAPTATQTTDWGLSYTTDPTVFSYDHSNLAAVNCYSPKFGTLKKDVDVIYNYKLTISGSAWTMYADDTQLATGSYTDGANYFYFVVNPKQGTDTAFYMDDFSITYAGGTIVDTFANGQSALFVESETKIGTGYGSTGMSFLESTLVESEGGEETPDMPEELGEVAMKLLLNNGDDGVRARTTNAYAGGSTVSFRYYIQADTAVQWTRFIWDTDTSCDNYASTYTSFGNTAGEWVTWSYTIPSGGPYYLYFGFECGNWGDSSGAPYILIDDFTVNGEVETFNYGVENSIFTILQSNLAGNSEVGAGFTPVNGRYGAKLQIDMISSTKTTPSFITSGTYVSDGTLTVSFDYYMSGNTNGKWWTLGWTTSNTNADIYAGMVEDHTSAENSAQSLPIVQDAWSTASVTIPAGEWYFYFAGAVGEWSGGYVIIDNFKIGDQVKETFNDGTYGIFLDNRDSKPDAITIAEGKEDFVVDEYATKIIVSKISSTASTPTFITSQAYTSDGTLQVTFDYYTSGSCWCMFGWTNSNTVASIYAHAESNQANNYGQDITLSNDWTTATITIPAGTWYFYFAGNKPDCSNNKNGCGSACHLVVDNFQIGDQVTETFNYGIADSIFTVRSSHASAIELTDGYVASEGEEGGEVVEGDAKAFETLLANGTIIEYLTTGAADYIFNGEVAVATEFPDVMQTMLILEASFEFTVKGNREFAVYFGNEYYIFINEAGAALYKGVDKVMDIAAKPVAGNANAFNVSVTGNKKLLIKLGNNSYEGLGVMDTLPTTFKIVGLGGDGSVSFADIQATTYSLVEGSEDAPIYFSNDTIDFTAYAFDSEAMISEEGFQLLAEAGFTKTLALLQGRLSSGDLHEQDIPDRAHVENLMTEVNADAMAALELAEKYGLKHYVLNSNIYNIERNENNYQWLDDFAELATYTLSKAFAGHFLADEPQSGNWFTTDELTELVNAYKAYKAAFPDSEAFINLLPRDSSQFTSESLYEDYIDTYIETIALDYNGVPGTGYVSFDHYPLHDDGITSTHLRNLELIAEKCRDNNLELRTYIKASTTGDSDRSIRATENKNDLMFQIYSALAYGSKEIIYYQFTDHNVVDGTPGDGVISGTSLNKENVYNWTKEVNNEVLNLSSAYMNFTWKSASIFGAKSITQFSNLQSEVSAYGALSDVTATDSSTSILVGNFDDSDGVMSGDFTANYGYMVVNYGDPNDGASKTNVTVAFDEAQASWVLVYRAGKTLLVELDGGNLTLADFEEGEGAFIVPILY